MRMALYSILFIVAFSTPALAQEAASDLDRIEVTGSRISYRDLLDTPAIAITKQGDYLLQKITLVNDTRSEEGRRQEIYATIEKMLARAAGRYQLLAGDGYRVVLDKSNYRVELLSDSNRPDVSRAVLQLRADISGEPGKGEQAVLAMRSFARESQKIGRTELDLDRDTALGMNKPERYRYDLIAAIAEDSRRVIGQLGAACMIELGGLNSRIEWERVSADELLLYVPYTMTISGCGLDSSPTRK